MELVFFVSVYGVYGYKVLKVNFKKLFVNRGNGKVLVIFSFFWECLEINLNYLFSKVVFVGIFLVLYRVGYVNFLRIFVVLGVVCLWVGLVLVYRKVVR